LALDRDDNEPRAVLDRGHLIAGAASGAVAAGDPLAILAFGPG